MEEKGMNDLAAILLGSGGLGAGIGLLANPSFTNYAAALSVIIITVGVAVILIVFAALLRERARRNTMDDLSDYYVEAVNNSGRTLLDLMDPQHGPLDRQRILMSLAIDLRNQGQRRTPSGRDVSRAFRDGTDRMARDLYSLACGQQELPPVLASAPYS